MREVVLPQQLRSLVMACQTLCVAECCGIHAFDFSPLHMASHLAWHTGAIDASDLALLERQVDLVVERAVALPADEHGWVCSIEGMNQAFTLESLQHFAGQLKSALAKVPMLWEFARQLRAPQAGSSTRPS